MATPNFLFDIKSKKRLHSRSDIFKRFSGDLEIWVDSILTVDDASSSKGQTVQNAQFYRRHYPCLFCFNRAMIFCL